MAGPYSFLYAPGPMSGAWDVTLPGEASIGELIVDAVVSASDIELEMLADSPVAMWPLNESSGLVAVDISGNGHHGTYSGTFDLAGPITFPNGTAHTRFHDPSVVNVPNDTPFSSASTSAGDTGEMTLEGWVNLDAFYAADNAIVLCKAGGASGNIEWVLSISPDGSADGYGFRAPSSLLMRCTAPAGTIGSAAWHHLVYTYNRATPLAVLYVDGAAVDSDATLTTDTVHTSQIVELGHRQAVVGGADAGHWQTLGTLAYLAYYDHALTATRVAAHYDAATP